jgi:hypothetical protein
MNYFKGRKTAALIEALLIASMYKYFSTEKSIELENKIIELQKMIAEFTAKLA